MSRAAAPAATPAAGPSAAHEVFSVCGRPFIAPSSEGRRKSQPAIVADRLSAVLEASGRPSPRTPGSAHELRFKQAALSASGLTSRRASVVLMPGSAIGQELQQRSRRASLDASMLPATAMAPAAAPAAASPRRSSLAAPGKVVAEEEWQALFRNNLLRSCWKPGLSQGEVQHILAMWERKLVESMHRWLHPDIWAGFRIWRYRTWPRSLLVNARARLYVRFIQPMLNRWRSHSRIQALAPFLRARLFHVHLRRWRLEAAFMRRTHLACLLFSFARMQRGVESARGLGVYMHALHDRRLRRAFNTWSDDTEQRRHVEDEIVRTIRSWQSGLRRALNTWCGLREAMEEVRLVAIRWAQYSIYRLWRRWSITYMRDVHSLRSAVRRWLETSLTKCVNTWAGKTRVIVRNLRLARHSLLTLQHQRQRLAFNAWASRAETGLARQHKLLSACEAMGGSQRLRALNTWRALAWERGRISALLYMMAPEGHAMRKAFVSWTESADLAAHQWSLLQRAAVGLKTRLLWGFNGKDEARTPIMPPPCLAPSPSSLHLPCSSLLLPLC